MARAIGRRVLLAQGSVPVVPLWRLELDSRNSRPDRVLIHKSSPSFSVFVYGSKCSHPSDVPFPPSDGLEYMARLESVRAIGVELERLHGRLHPPLSLIRLTHSNSLSSGPLNGALMKLCSRHCLQPVDCPGPLQRVPAVPCCAVSEAACAVKPLECGFPERRAGIVPYLPQTSTMTTSRQHGPRPGRARS